MRILFLWRFRKMAPKGDLGELEADCGHEEMSVEWTRAHRGLIMHRLIALCGEASSVPSFNRKVMEPFVQFHKSCYM